MKQPLTLKIDGMHCSSCETLITEELKETTGVSDISVSSKNGQAELLLDTNLTPVSAVIDAVKRAGYRAAVANLPVSFAEQPSVTVIKNQPSKKPMQIRFESHIKAEGKILEDENGKAYFSGNLKNDRKAIVSAHKEDFGSEEKVHQLVNSLGVMEIFNTQPPPQKNQWTR